MGGTGDLDEKGGEDFESQKSMFRGKWEKKVNSTGGQTEGGVPPTPNGKEPLDSAGGTFGWVRRGARENNRSTGRGD